MKEKIIAVIPAFNEAKYIGFVIEKTINHVDEIIVVNDNSSDETSILAKRKGAKIINLQKNIGNSGALIEGFKYAIKVNCSKIVTIDADYAHDPDEIPALLKNNFQNKSDITIGDRFQILRPGYIPTTKIYSNYFASHLMNLILGTSFNDTACGFRVIKTSFATRFINSSVNSNGFSLVYDTIIYAALNKCTISTEPVSVHYDASELMYTDKKELLDLVTTLSNIPLIESYIQSTLAKLRHDIINSNPFTVLFNKETLCVIPFEHSGGYVFQKQDSFFINNVVGSVYSFKTDYNV